MTRAAALALAAVAAVAAVGCRRTPPGMEPLGTFADAFADAHASRRLLALVSPT